MALSCSAPFAHLSAPVRAVWVAGGAGESERELCLQHSGGSAPGGGQVSRQPIDCSNLLEGWPPTRMPSPNPWMREPGPQRCPLDARALQELVLTQCDVPQLTCVSLPRLAISALRAFAVGGPTCGFSRRRSRWISPVHGELWGLRGPCDHLQVRALARAENPPAPLGPL